MTEGGGAYYAGYISEDYRGLLRAMKVTKSVASWHVDNYDQAKAVPPAAIGAVFAL